MVPLAYSRAGRGDPLVLLHPLGSHRRVWEPIMPTLAGHFDVIAVDLPGFGDSPALPAATEATPAALARAVDHTLDALDVRHPHVAGNSLGGWIALELATLRPLRSLALLSPAGLWKERTPRYCWISLRLSRWLAYHARPILDRLVDHAAGRVLVLGQTHGRPAGMPAERARAAVDALGTCPGFDRSLRATKHRSYVPGPSLSVPVSVAFGSRDLLLLPHQSRRTDLLPPGTQVTTLAGCGHLPVGDDPGAVAAFIERAASRAHT